MPSRAVVRKELAELFGVLAHPDRIRIIAELRRGEVDVQGLQDAIGVTQARASQHLSVPRLGCAPNPEVNSRARR